MSSNDTATRRRFFLKAGAVLSAPIAAAVGGEAAARVTGAAAARVSLLEDVNAIRELHETYVRLLNRGDCAGMARLFTSPGAMVLDDTVRKVSADRFAEHDIEIEIDGSAATARMHCNVEIESEIEPGWTLVDMARGQGEGVLCRTEARVLEGRYLRRDGAWKITHVTLHPVADPR